MKPTDHRSQTLPLEIERNPAFYKALLEENPAGILVIDRGYRIHYVNPTGLEWIQRPASEVLGRPCHEALFGSKEPCRVGTDPCPAATVLTAGRPAGPVVLSLETRGGGQRYVQVRSAPILEQGGGSPFVIEFFLDVTAEVRIRDFSEEASLRDPLTGLYNRQAFHPVLQRELKRTRRQGHPLSLCLVDVDSFKDYNERGGDKAGDVLLEQLAHILTRQTRSGVDSIFRIQADTFGILLPEATREQALEIARRIRKASEDARLPVSLSMAICESREQEAPDTLSRRTLDLLFQAKRGGGGRIV